MIEIQCGRCGKKLDIVRVILLGFSASNSLAYLVTGLLHRIPVKSRSSHHVELLVCSFYCSIVLVEHHGCLRVHCELVGCSDDLLIISFSLWRDFEIEVCCQKGRAEVCALHDICRTIWECSGSFWDCLRYDWNWWCACSTEYWAEDEYSRTSVLWRRNELLKILLELIWTRVLCGFDDWVVHHHRTEVCLCSVSVTEVEILYILWEYKVCKVCLSLVCILSVTITEHILECALDFIVRTEFVVLKVCREEGVLAWSSSWCLQWLGVEICILNCLETSEVTIVLVSVKGKEVKVSLIEHSYGTQVY